ncbi:transcription factor LHW-like isoform X3 [Rosa rugosa]|uniref:transcription factor LHW-like isoform X3 n=1 Tax=Rosa rugosa TaxID=74645 RepID=UPI002B406AB1|nr:transcription factor LHW-like isoform X3 [Rosa rugosa]
MGTTALRQLLKNLCSNSLWNYGVFWKLKHQTDLILSWEDGYCHQPKPRETVDRATDSIYFGEANEISFKKCATGIHEGGSAGYPIGLAVADMSHLQYTFGKGVVGQVASTGNHSWVLLDGLRTSVSDSNLVSDCPDEWLLQFALGVKTILLVPVLPHGVLQFGSLETVPAHSKLNLNVLHWLFQVDEDLAVVAFMKDRFNDIHNLMGKAVSSNLNRGIQAPYSWSLLSGLMENTYESSTVGINPLKVETSEDIGNNRRNDNLLSTLEQFVQFPTIEDPHFGIDPSVLKNAGECEIGVPAFCSTGEANTVNQSTHTSVLDMVENQIFGLSCQEEELFAFSQNGGYNFGVFGESFGGFNSNTAGSAAEQLFKFNNDTRHNSVNNFFEFPETSELHKALGTSFQRQTNEQLWDLSISIDDTCSSSGVQKDLISSINPPWFSNGCDAENLLEASVAKDDTSSSISDGIKSCTTSSRQFSASYKQLKFEEGGPMECEPMIWSHTSALPATRKTSSSFTGMMNTVVDNEQEEKGTKGHTPTQPKREQKLSGTNARRAKPGNSPKLRPRDRQLIQDRVKELRELVPNGAKCSIDGLLDRTIKHMMYLRSMSNQAEKLKSYAHQDQEAPRCNNTNETPSGSSNGTSRAFELGNELQISPIVVEDLEHPGHMLIEMLCDEHGLFLEIAQAIRRLELTVLKGVMETRSNNLWAHFVVEAPRGFHRMDVFWPLLHLLQRRRGSLSSKI